MVAFTTRLTPAMIAGYEAAGWWKDETFADVLARRVAEHPDREALYDRRRRVSYRQLAEMIDRVAAKLQSLGIGRGDVVTVQLPNWIEFAACFMAAERIGAVAIQISTDFRAREVSFILGFAESRAYICSAGFRGFDYPAMVAGIRAGLPRLEQVLLVDAAARPGAGSLQAAIEGDERLPLSPVRLGANEVFRMAFTSGTTGNPKAVIHSFNTTLTASWIQQRDLGTGADDVFLIYLPLGLNWGYLALMQAIQTGARAVLLDRFSAADALGLIEQERVTYVPTAPASVIAMLNDPALARADTTSLRMMISGGASCPVEAIREYRAKMRGRFIELYGMLETGFHSYTRPDDDPEQVSGTVGRAATAMGVRLLDEASRDVARGAEGEIAALGPSVHLGYHNNPAANAELFTADGWFRTGDMAVMDGADRIRIVGRSKELVNRGGKKFHPREIEEILYTHPKVMHVAIVGAPDPRLGERNALCVIPRAGQTVTMADMLAMLEGQVATYKLPEEFHLFEAFPYTPTGKLQRHELARLVQDRRVGPGSGLLPVP
jgi:acyl-CoA synthetase (AMP-forming)/AMP-acid ligase II